MMMNEAAGHNERQPIAMERDDISSKPPKASIGLPVYNGGRYIKAAIASILEQTFEDFELVIGDNASTDDTEAICRAFAAQDSRVIYIRHPENLGASANFQSVFENSRGAYFRWHGHDDLLEPTYLERLVEALDEDPRRVLAFTNAVIIDAADRPKWCFMEFYQSDSDRADERLRTWLQYPKDDITNPIFGLMRRDALARTDLMAPYLASDRTLLAHMALLGRSRLVKECLFLRRVHDEMSTAANRDHRNLRAWFDRKRPLLTFKQWRLLFEYLRVINRTPLGLATRLRCYGVMLMWIRTRGRRLGLELALPFYLNGRFTRLGHVFRRALRRILPA